MITRDILDSLDKEVLIELIIKLSQELDSLKGKFSELETRLNKNSSNSSKPPSSDGLRKKPAPKSLRGKSGKRSGGQIGHKGGTLKQVSHPDVTIMHDVSECNHCAADLSTVDISSIQARQVFDIPRPKIEVTEHVAIIKGCPNCATVNKAAFPNNVTAPVQYGVRIQATAVYMLYQQFIPEDRLAEMFADLYGINICSATLVGVGRKLHKALATYESETEKFLSKSVVANFDESGMRVSGKLRWLHSVSNVAAVIYKLHEKRGFDAMDSFYVHKNFSGIAVHDHWKPYFKLNTNKHGLCNAHILRELVGIHENSSSIWAKAMEKFLYKAHRYVECHKQDGKLPADYLMLLQSEYDKILIEATHYYNRYSSCKTLPPGKALLTRLQNYKPEILRFMYDFKVPFSNNQAEQDIRMCKLRAKISGCFRSDVGSEVFCRIRGYLATARKQGINTFDAIVDAIAGKPFTTQAI